jgi:guanylate kinase
LVLIEIDPRLLVPLLDVRSADESRIAQMRVRLSEGWAPDPLICCEADGYLFIVDGHHRWAASLLRDEIRPVSVELVDAIELSSVSPLDAGALINEVNWSSVYDWEAAFSVRLVNGAVEKASIDRPLTILSGPSGVGKTTLIASLKRRGVSLANLRTTTTRRRRSDEVAGVDYDFVDIPTFRALAKSGAFCEWQMIHGNYYGSPWETFFPERETGLRVTSLDTYGALQLRSLYPAAIQAVFVEAPSFAELTSRLALRGSDSPTQSVLRLTRARREMQLRRLFDSTVVNESIDRTATQVLQLSRVGRLKSQPVPFYLDRDAIGNYIALAIRDKKGEILCWRNLRHPVAPLLRLRSGVTEAVGWRQLESMFIDQLMMELQHNPRGGAILRELVHALDDAETVRVPGGAASKNVTINAKIISLPILADFVREDSEFFGYRAGLFSGADETAALM